MRHILLTTDVVGGVWDFCLALASELHVQRAARVTLLALGEPSGLAEGASPRDDLPYALSGKVLGQTQLTGKYARKR